MEVSLLQNLFFTVLLCTIVKNFGMAASYAQLAVSKATPFSCKVKKDKLPKMERTNELLNSGYLFSEQLFQLPNYIRCGGARLQLQRDVPHLSFHDVGVFDIRSPRRRY